MHAPSARIACLTSLSERRCSGEAVAQGSRLCKRSLALPATSAGMCSANSGPSLSLESSACELWSGGSCCGSVHTHTITHARRLEHQASQAPWLAMLLSDQAEAVAGLRIHSL